MCATGARTADMRWNGLASSVPLALLLWWGTSPPAPLLRGEGSQKRAAGRARQRCTLAPRDNTDQLRYAHGIARGRVSRTQRRSAVVARGCALCVSLSVCGPTTFLLWVDTSTWESLRPSDKCCYNARTIYRRQFDSRCDLLARPARQRQGGGGHSHGTLRLSQNRTAR